MCWVFFYFSLLLLIHLFDCNWCFDLVRNKRKKSDTNECRILYTILYKLSVQFSLMIKFMFSFFSHILRLICKLVSQISTHKEYVSEISMKRLRSLVECVAHIWSPINHKRNWEYWIWLLKWSWRWSSKLEVSVTSLDDCNAPKMRLCDTFHHCLLLLCTWFFAERNLNPKAACLKRREEEKAEDGPKLPQHHMLSNAYPVGMSASNISFDFWIEMQPPQRIYNNEPITTALCSIVFGTQTTI